MKKYRLEVFENNEWKVLAVWDESDNSDNWKYLFDWLKKNKPGSFRVVEFE